ncbi:MAG: alpha/beta hydrolase [Gammaproteobacteria bacterium]|nr:alpha/beta hydrolase [Gammaproteobacteria bacterium]
MLYISIKHSDLLPSNALFYVFNLVILLSLSSAWAAEENYIPVESDVSFESVLDLPFRESDYQISYGNDPFQFGRLWLPVGGRLGTLVFIHGGCWLNEYNIDHAQGLSTALASAGYAVWSLEYRRTGDEGGGWPGTFDDIIAGINKTLDLAPYGVGVQDLALVGHSAGGHLAVLAGAHSDRLTVEPDLVVGLAAITNVTSYSLGENSCQQATPRFMGGVAEEREEAFYDANPSNHGIHSPTFLLQGDIDQIVPPEQALLPDATTVMTSGAGHFDWVHPGTAAYRNLLGILSAEL